MSTAGLVHAAFEEIGAYKARTFLSILSVVVGIASITFIVAVGEVGRAAAVSALERQSGRSATVNVGLAVPDWAQLDPYGVASELREAALGSGATASAIAAGVDGSVAIGGFDRPAQVVGTQPDLAIIRRLKMVDGRWIGPIDDVRLAPAIVMPRASGHGQEHHPCDPGLSLPSNEGQDAFLIAGWRVLVRFDCPWDVP